MEKFRVNIASNFRFQLQRTRDRKKQERNPHMASPLTATSSIIIVWATVKQRRKRRFICVNLSLPYLVAKKKVRRTYSLSPVVVKVEVCVTDAGESEEREGDRRMELFFLLLLLIKNLIVILYRSKPKRYPTKNGSRWWRTTCAATAS